MLFVASLGWPDTAVALPTPDALINVLQIFPILFGGIAGIIAAAGIFLRRHFAKVKNPVRFLSFSIIGLCAALFISLGTIAVYVSAEDQHQRMLDTAMYYRSDIALDALELHARETASLWLDENGPVQELRGNDVAAVLSDKPTPILINLGRLQLSHDSGTLVLNIKQVPHPFRYVRASELVGFLTRLLEFPANSSRPVIFQNWHSHTKWDAYDGESDLVRTLGLFDAVYALPSGLATGDDSMFEISLPDPQSGEWIRASRVRGLIDYPVRTEGLAFNEAIVNYPNLLHLLTAAELAGKLKDPEVVVVAPFSSLYRKEDVQRYFVEGYFKLVKLDQNRLVLIDFNAADVSAQIDRLSSELVGQKFITVALSKQDWVYMGVDLAYRVWLSSGKDARRFFYQGSSVQFPEATALLAFEQSTLVLRGIRKLQKLFNLTITALARQLDISLGMALLLFAIALRLLLSPIGYLEAYSRFLRNDLKIFAGSSVTNNPGEYFLLRNVDSIARILGSRRSIEIVGSLLSLGLILPFYTLIINLPVPDIAPSFVWVASITNPSVWLSVLLVAVIAIKIIIGRIGPSGISPRFAALKSVDAITAIVLIGFIFLLAKIPAAVVIYALGVIFTQTILDLLARTRSRHKIFRALQLAPATATSTDSQNVCSVLSLMESAQRADIGNKARRLGDLQRDDSPLFTVPQGVVILNTGVELAEQNPESFIGRVLPDLAKVVQPASLLAVRSCGLAEDGSHASQAGRYKTMLNVSRQDLVSAVCEVAASFGVEERENRCVIVQQMVDADFAGVLFSAAPDNAQATALEFNRGLGDRLVSGETQPVALSIGRFTGAFQRQDNQQSYEDNLPKMASGSLILRLALIGRIVEEKFGAPQDIEWAYSVDDDRLHVLQSRDITASIQSEVLAREQARLLMDATSQMRIIKPGSTVWCRSDIAEVVEQPTPFTISLMERLYSNSGALGLAMRRLGFFAPTTSPGAVVSVFGQLMDVASAGPQRGRGWLRNLLATRRIAHQFKRDPRVTLIEPLRQRLEDRYQQTRSSTMKYSDLPTKSRQLFRLLEERLSEFIEGYYPIAYETTLLAKLAERHLPKKTLGDSGQMPTRTTMMFRDLQSLENKADLSSFLNEWGHRGPDDYELARPSFAESPELVRKMACRFTGNSVSGQTMSPSQAYEADYPSNIYDEMVCLKEMAKDESIRHLRSIKPIFVKLSDVLSVPLEILFGLHYSEISSLAWHWSESRTQCLLEGAAVRLAELEELRGVPLADRLSLENVEFQDARSYMDGIGIDPELNAAPDRVGRMISSRQAFSGVVCRIDSDVDYDKPIDTGSILVTKHLSPKLVPLFDEAAGCISERGGMLSHAAIVAREMGFPVLVGVDIMSPEFQESRRLRVSADGVIDTLD